MGVRSGCAIQGGQKSRLLAGLPTPQARRAWMADLNPGLLTVAQIGGYVVDLKAEKHRLLRTTAAAKKKGCGVTSRNYY